MTTQNKKETLVELLERRFVTADCVIEWNEQTKNLLSKYESEQQPHGYSREDMEEFIEWFENRKQYLSEKGIFQPDGIIRTWNNERYKQ